MVEDRKFIETMVPCNAIMYCEFVSMFIEYIIMEIFKYFIG